MHGRTHGRVSGNDMRHLDSVRVLPALLRQAVNLEPQLKDAPKCLAKCWTGWGADLWSSPLLFRVRVSDELLTEA